MLNSKFQNDQGQGLIEFLLFLPFLLMSYQITLSMGNAINGSINQQKFTRGYHYARTKYNSMLPTPQSALSTSLEQYGMYFTGWAAEFQDAVPVAPCYPFKTMLKTSNQESCEEGYSTNTTQLIRVVTVYGVCPTTFRKEGSFYEKSIVHASSDQACTNQ